MSLNKVHIKEGLFLSAQQDEQHWEVITGHMVIEGDTIIYLDTKPPDLSGTPQEQIQTIDGKHKLYMPGLVNSHGHAAMSLLRGFADDLALQVWLEEKIWPNEAKFGDREVDLGARLSIVEMIRSGTTSFVDMYDRMEVVARAVMDSGMRGCLTQGMIGFGSEQVLDKKLAAARAFAEEWHGKADGRITAMMSPHAPYTCTPDFIRKIVDAAEELNLPIHIHMSETQVEVAQNVEQYGQRPVAHLRDIGVFERPCLVAHAVHLTPEEIQILKQYDVRVSHNPGSNLKLASGIAPVPQMLAAGVNVSLGTDSSASNNNLDMFEEIRLAALLHKGVSGDPTAVPAETALRLGTIEGAKSIWLEKTGALRTGWKADFISLNVDQPHYYPHGNWISHLAYAASSEDVMDVWVDGHQLMKDREMLTLDEEKIKHEFQDCYDHLLKKR